MKAPKLHLTDEIITDGYGPHRLYKCSQNIGELHNIGYNVFIGNFTEVLLDNPHIDISGVYQPGQGWCYIDFADKREKMFIAEVGGVYKLNG